MKIDYILSDTTKNATTNALASVVKLAEENLFENYIVIVPETKSIIIEKELLSLSTRKSFLNVFVYSFVRLLDRFDSVPREQLVSKQTCVLLLRKIILDNIENLTCYNKSAKMVGFAEKMYETIAQFKSSDITPDELKKGLETKKDSLKQKLKDIILIYEQYEKALSEGLFDDCDKLALVSKFANENEFLKDSHVFVVGFDNITPEMQRVLTDLSKNSKSITFSCVYFSDKRKDKFIQKNELFGKFLRVADRLHYPYNPMVFTANKNHDLKIIKNNLFVQSDEKFESKGNIKIFQAKSVKEEIDFVANTILRQVEAGRRYKDIGVLALNINETHELFEECFNVYGIPYFINIPRKIDNHFLVRFVELAFEMVSFRLQREKVLEFVSNPLFDAENYDMFENFVNETGVNYSEFSGEDIYIKLKNHYSLKEKFFDENDEEDSDIIVEDTQDNEDKKRKLDEKIEKISQILIKFQDFYKIFAKKLKESNSILNYIDAVKFLIEYFDIQNSIMKISAFQSENGDEISAQITNIILEKVDAFNRQIVTFLGNTEVGLTEFLMIYKTGFSSIKLNLSPLSIDCIIIQDSTDGFFDIKDMFLVGAIEGDFPRKIADTGIILDSEIDETKMLLNKELEPKIEEINNRAKFSAYEALLEPSENLFISYSVKSITGKTTVCAKLITDVNKLFGEKILFNKYRKTEHINYNVLETRFVQKINNLQRTGDDVGADDVNYYYSLIGENIDERLKKYIEQYFDEKTFNVLNADQLYFKNNTTSVSKLQTYFGCPYKFFATYGLNLEENKIAKANVLDVGVVIHRVAELFAQDFDKYNKLNDDDLAIAVNDILNRALDERKIIREKNKTLIKLLTDESIKLAKYMIYEQNNSSFKIDKVEYFFSEKSGIKIAISDDKYVTIIGKIDRIDKFNDFVRVIDYKTGRIDDNLQSIFYGTKIQLAIYLMAIQNYGSKKAAGILYFPIHSNYDEPEKLKNKYKMSGFVLDNPEVMMQMDHNVSLDNTRSSILPLIIKVDKKTGEISYSETIKSKYSEQEFKDICDYVGKLSKIAIEEILSGYNEPSPISEKEAEIPDTCQNCKLFGFCGLEYSKHKFGRNNSGEIDISSFNFDGGNENE